MDFQKIMQSGFYDELEKISGELQGFTRIGRKPIGIERMLERETESEVTPTDVVEKAIERPGETEKLSEISPNTLKSIGLLAGGALGYHALRKTNEDRKLGRQLRLQNQQ
jgi:hypothetical protein